ncbi:MAG: hypothetical protein LBS50_11235 [Prevotellaceae bacterium]|jgi:hypothetical protein|nr:hypothetical protein [Prevotellaceae bacterium]
MNTQEIIKTELEVLQADVITRQQAAGKSVTGKTRDLFSVENVSIEGGQLWGAAYAGVLERGRRAGKVPYDFKDILLRWAKVKGISFQNNSDADRWAYFVAKKIREEGTALYRSGQTEDIFTTAISEFEDRLAERVSLFYQMEIQNNIFNII